ncbi:MAG: helix-turn-helix transcriptional regulator [Actinomycetota bacterium]
MKNYTWEEHKKELLKDPEFCRDLEACEPEFALAREIIKGRIQASLTQSELAKKAETSQVVISRLENGRMNPSVNLLKRVAKGLGKHISISFK